MVLRFNKITKAEKEGISMKKLAKQISEKDNVATCVADLKKGETVTVRLHGQESQYVAAEDIPFGHKIALEQINAGDSIVKYGTVIGEASQQIMKGEWVHCHNCLDTYEVK
jgi:altronate dehydratase small subunit